MPKHIVLYLILLLGSLLSLGSAPSVPQELDISFNHDLLYLNTRTGALMIWPAGEDGPQLLAAPKPQSPVRTEGNIIAVSVSDGGSQLALTVERSHRSYSILWLDVSALELVQIASVSTSPDVKISPNGRWLAYREEESTEIFAVNIDYPEEVVVVGRCEGQGIGCGSFHWSPNSAQLAWSDGRGLWIAQPPSFQKKVLNRFLLRRSEEGDRYVGYAIHSWSPNSRYLVLVRFEYIEGIVAALFDAQNGTVVDFPGTFQHGDTLPLFITWLDNDLLSVNSRDGWFERGPGMNIWRVDPSSSELLVLEKRYYFGMPCGLVSDVGLYGEQSYYHTILFVERDYCDEEIANGLYFSSKSGSNPALALELAEHEHYWYQNFIWSPDLRSSILFLESWSFLNLEHGTVEDLAPIIGNSEDVCCFTWLE